MKEYSAKQAPLRVFGIPNFEKTKEFRRVPDEVLRQIPSLDFLGKRPPGGRVCFRTDSPTLTVRLTLETLSVDIGMSIYACQSAHVFLGGHTDSVFLGQVNPSNYESKIFEKTFKTNGKMEDVTIFLPRNEILSDLTVLVEDGATVAPPTPYRHSHPVLYYGSSITEGGIANSPANGYNAILSRHLDVDYYNFGFSGSAKGELAMADYINTIDFSVFVYDYDHNAPTVEHLAATHEPFFRRIREKHPTVPVIMLTRPHATYGEDEIARRAVVKATYDRAVAEGDQNVYFIDGERFFLDDPDRELCFIDTIHPNDLGFAKMAAVIEPTLHAILERL
ncbi:MAG: hypothetical protein J6D21_08655 [Clostridia bacterium]|nr:hypothetical protein [Clostridia bacterium]